MFDTVDTECTTTVRMLAVDAVQKANSGHPGLPLGAADFVHVIWTRFLKVSPATPTWFNRDRFVLSGGHGSALLYSILHLAGFPLTIEDLKQFRQMNSKTPGHPEHSPEMGIETTTGPLGQGLANAVGMALAERILAAKFNKPGFSVVDHHTYVVAGDGDLMEGISHEAASLAGHLGLDKLIVFYDDNNISIDGPTDITLSDDALARFASYGWDVQRCDGHNFEAIEDSIRKAEAVPNRPHLIACKTTIGLKSPMAGTAKVHGTPLGAEGVAKTKTAFGRGSDLMFHVPDNVRARYADYVAARGASACQAWNELFSKYAAEHAELAAQFKLIEQNQLPVNWQSVLPSFTAGTAPMATRVSSGRVLETLVPALPSLIGGSADLTPSNNTKTAASVSIARGRFAGNYVHYGVREFAMGAVMNGLALHNLRPYGATFLVFSDYVRPAVRMAALMHLPVIFVFTHDSIGLGEDGPTHQPVEHLLALRSIPGLAVMRPADANEVAACWRLALERHGPSALVLSRQDLPLLSPPGAEGVSKGAYVIGDDVQAPQIVLMATGSEVAIAVEAKRILEQDQIHARVVSVPSFELFDAQPALYKDTVLPPGVPRISMEAALTASWTRFGCVRSLGIDTFGASAPAKLLYEHFGLTPTNFVATAKQVLKK